MLMTSLEIPGYEGRSVAVYPRGANGLRCFVRDSVRLAIAAVHPLSFEKQR